MSSQSFEYKFIAVDKCNMCGASKDQFKVMGKRLNKSQGFNPNSKVGITTTVIKCRRCNLIFSNPQPVPNDIQDHYGVIPESYWTKEYLETNEQYFEGEIQWLKRLINGKSGMKSLDIGAGIGKQMTVLRKAGFDAYGIEPSYSFYDRAIGKNEISKNKIFNVSIEDADFEENSFHFISFGAVLEHLHNPSESIRKAFKWLRDDGLIHIEVPSSSWLINKIINVVYKSRGLDYVGNISPMHAPYHLYEFSLRSFKENGLQNGFEVHDYAYYVCKTYLNPIFDPILRSVMKTTNTGMQLCVWLKKRNFNN